MTSNQKEPTIITIQNIPITTNKLGSSAQYLKPFFYLILIIGGFYVSQNLESTKMGKWLFFSSIDFDKQGDKSQLGGGVFGVLMLIVFFALFVRSLALNFLKIDKQHRLIVELHHYVAQSLEMGIVFLGLITHYLFNDRHKRESSFSGLQYILIINWYIVGRILELIGVFAPIIGTKLGQSVSFIAMIVMVMMQLLHINIFQII